MKPVSIQHLVPPWLASLVPYQPGKPIEEVEREYGIRESIKLASNENPLGSSPRAVAALRAAIGDVHRYPDGGGFYLKQKLAGKLGVGADQVALGNGSNEILELLARSFLRPGDDAVMSEQAFVIYASVVQAAAGIPRAVPLRDFMHDLDAMAASIRKSTRLVFLGNPNNPTGTIYRRDAFERFLRRVPSDVIIVADDAYAEYVEDPEYPQTLEYQKPDRLLVTLRTFSKIYGLAGLRIGYGVGPAEVIAALERIRQPFNVNSLAQAAALAALDDEEHVERSRRTNRDGMRHLEREFERLGLAYVPSQANFILVRVGDGAAVYEKLLRQGVIVRPMAGYAFPEHVRVTVGTAEENRRFVDALEKTLG
ncbi:MAG TPA: histidinol-phosphate transaminase [Candidatus Binatia bacterium]|nr:histidinol-phosphate transaminase [Candidatus Binatia bacterium]